MSTYWLHVRSELELQEFVEKAGRALSLGEMAEHESENYSGGVYFRGQLGQVTLEIADEDTPGYDEYQYWIILVSEDTLHEEQIDTIVVQLLSAGLDIALGLDESESMIRRRVYRLNGTNLSSHVEEVILEM